MWLTSGLTSRVCVYCSGLSCSWPIVKSQQILPEVLESHCSRSQPLKDTTKMTKENLTGSQFFLEYGYENRKFSLSSTLSNSIGINTLLVSSDYTIMTIETSFFFLYWEETGCSICPLDALGPLLRLCYVQCIDTLVGSKIWSKLVIPFDD